jgi:hypothetical protein
MSGDLDTSKTFGGRLEFLLNLAPPDPTWPGTGALFRKRQVTDFQLQHEPGVVEALAAGVPASFMVLELADIAVRYDQDGEGACVAYSIAGAKSIEDFQDSGVWRKYDAEELYRACGGTGPNGIPTDQALAYVKSVGCLFEGKRWPIASYLFAPEAPSAWRQTLAASLVANGPAVVATLLPATFGWDSNEVLTSGYHQLCLIGYDGLGDSDHAVFLNSWPAPRVFVRLSWGYLERGNFQNGYVYGYQMVDVREGPAPVPIPVDFNATIGKTKPNGAVQLWPDPPATVQAGTRVHVTEIQS